MKGLQGDGKIKHDLRSKETAPGRTLEKTIAPSYRAAPHPGIGGDGDPFVNPLRTLPMLLEQGASVFLRKAYPPLRYHWIDLDQMPEMFLKHLWISEEQRFFKHHGFDWKDRPGDKECGADRETGARSVHDHKSVRALDLSLAGAFLDLKGLGIALNNLDGNAPAKAAHFRAIRQRDRDGTRNLRRVEAASQYYFEINARGLTRTQSVLLAAVLPNPKRWNPAHPGAALRRREQRILAREREARLPGELLR